MPYPLISTLTGYVTYSDMLTPLDGYVLLLIEFPTGYSSASIANQLIPQTIAKRVKVRIQQGAYDQSSRIIQNAYLEPPSTRYTAYFYDNNNVLLGYTNVFTISVSPYTINFPPMPLPGTTLSLSTLTDAQLAALTDEQLATLAN